MSGPFVVALDGAAVPGGHYTPISLLSNPIPQATIHTNFSDVVNVVGRPLTTQEDDWLDLLAAIYVADLLCPRGDNEDYTRDIHIAMRVRNPAAVQPVLPTLEEIFERLCQDRLTIVVEGWDTFPRQRFPSRQEVAPAVDVVALLSGGLDSASTAARLLDEGATPCFVSSETAGHVIASQRRVLSSLAGRFGKTPLSAGFSVGLRNRPASPLPRAREHSQRSRTLLFIGVAALIASGRGVPDVVVGENGVMAINAPLTGGRFGPFSTHTAHPHVLLRIAAIANAALNGAIHVNNPSAFETKTEVVQRLVDLGLASVVPQTHSCWIARRDTHCGKCVPCIVRRIAVATVGVVDATYDRDIYGTPWDPADPSERDLADYITFARTVRESNDIELILRFAELAIPGGPPARTQAISMYRRWVGDVIGFLAAQPQLASVVI